MNVCLHMLIHRTRVYIGVFDIGPNKNDSNITTFCRATGNPEYGFGHE